MEQATAQEQKPSATSGHATMTRLRKKEAFGQAWSLVGLFFTQAEAEKHRELISPLNDRRCETKIDTVTVSREYYDECKRTRKDGGQ